MPRPRQAVVVIHGMGEQRPMGTLRTFADAAVPADGGQRYWSKPDEVSASFELRRYVVPSTASRPVTNLYEYYWADKMTGNRLRDLLPLLRALMWRWPWRIRGSVRWFWAVCWSLLGILLVVVAMTVVQRGPLALLDSPADVVRQVTGTDGDEVSRSSAAGWLVLLGAVALAVVPGKVVSSFGDVARYLDSSPGNVGVRHDIKASACALLEGLHGSGRYDRIVIVGHSLGSMIGLDAITHYWARVHDRHGSPELVDQRCLDRVEQLGVGLSNGDDRWPAAQRALWCEQRRLGVPWLVTDFVTVGSPLSHADWLMAGSRAELKGRFARRELLHDPPCSDGRRPYSYRTHYTPAGQERSLNVLHHAAAFACTRWTNIWFPAPGGIFGDPFGGPLSGIFGPGIADRPVTAGPWWTRHRPFLAHSAYWSDPDGGPGGHPPGHHVRLLREALDLDSCDWLRDVLTVESPPPACEGRSMSEPGPGTASGDGDHAPRSSSWSGIA